jgi:hypothetical protein
MARVLVAGQWREYNGSRRLTIQLFCRRKLMDPLTALIAALVLGAAEGLKATASQAIKDGYSSLKALLLHKFGDKGEVNDALEGVERKPDSEGRKTTLKEELEAAEAYKDEELLAAAKALLEKADPQGAQKGKYNIAFHGEVKGAVIGDHSQVQMTFGGDD